MYRDNRPGEHPETDGGFSAATLRWIEETLIRSKREKKAVIAFTHHGIVEHYPDNEKYYDKFVINDFRRVSALFAAYGVRLVFTGHYHAQDITLRKIDGTGRFVYDIETGSFVTHPCPYG
jgi:3',5'-cyclic AMP phosphodiesterase CpdA